MYKVWKQIMSTSLVLELQAQALDKRISVADLLRKALVIAKKLSIPNFPDWINLELNGYRNQSSPSYRRIYGQPKVNNPHVGWIPIMIDNNDISNFIRVLPNHHSISELEHMVHNEQKGIIIKMPYPPDIETLLVGLIQEQFGFVSQPFLIVDTTQLHGIIETVRNVILEWTLQLEKEGIVGEGMTFSAQEKQIASTAQSITTYYITNASNFQFQQGDHNTQSLTIQNLPIQEIQGFLAEIKEKLDQLNLDTQMQEELQVDIQTVLTQLSSPNPKKPIIIEGLKSIRALLEGITGNALATIFMNQFPTIF